MEARVKRIEFQAVHREMFEDGKGILLPEGWIPLEPPEVVAVDRNGVSTLHVWAWKEEGDA